VFTWSYPEATVRGWPYRCASRSGSWTTTAPSRPEAVRSPRASYSPNYSGSCPHCLAATSCVTVAASVRYSSLGYRMAPPNSEVSGNSRSSVPWVWGYGEAKRPIGSLRTLRDLASRPRCLRPVRLLAGRHR